MNMVFLRILKGVLIVMAFVALGVMPGCSRSDKTDRGTVETDASPVTPIRHGGVYTLPLRYNPTTLDPARLHDWNGYFIAHQIFEGLVQFGPHLTVLPSLAESWQVEDKGKVYRFFLQKEAKFHNGSTVTADDVLFSIQRLLRMDPPPAILPHLLKITGATAYRARKSDRLQGVQVINAHEVLVRLAVPHAPFITALGMCQAAVVPHAELAQNEKGFGRHPIGSGPFKFITWESGQTIRLERFAEYHAGAAFLDAVDFRIYPGGDLAPILDDFKKERLMEMPAHGFIKKALAGKKHLNWYRRPSLGILFYGIRANAHPLLKNSDFRKALLLAVDQHQLAREVYQGQFDAAQNLIPPGIPGFERRQAIDNRWAVALQCFNRAVADTPGVEPRIEIVTAIESPLSTAELAFVKRSWRKLGVIVDVKFITNWEKFESYLTSDAVQIYRYAWLADMPDPDSVLYPLFGSDSPVNYARYHSATVDRLLALARGMTDPVERAQTYTEIERLVMADVPVIPMAYLNVDRVYQGRVKGMEISALGFQSTPLHRVWLDDPLDSE